MSLPLSPLAKRVLPLIDLTELAPDCTPADVTALCKKARALALPVAALCVRPAFVAQVKTELAGGPIKVATVINFPTATISLEQCSQSTDAALHASATRSAVTAGADEIDVVMPYAAFQAGQGEAVRQMLDAVKEACGNARLKVILESGAYSDMNQLHAAAELAVDIGADFLKTSTGFHTNGATLEAAELLCAVSAAYSKQIAIKISGGVRTAAQAQSYLDLVAKRMGLNWITPENFRFGASKLVDALLAPAAPTAVGY